MTRVKENQAGKDITRHDSSFIIIEERAKLNIHSWTRKLSRVKTKTPRKTASEIREKKTDRGIPPIPFLLFRFCIRFCFPRRNKPEK
jgi:hypothetical protein